LNSLDPCFEATDPSATCCAANSKPTNHRKKSVSTPCSALRISPNAPARHIHDLFEYILTLRTSGLEATGALAKTLSEWTEEILRMWRFSRNNSITEGFHRKMKLIQRHAYGFRSFSNYRLRVIAQCG
jgi:Transposase